MNRTTSIYLDLLRLGAALVVFFGHFTRSTFCTIFPDLQIYAVCAVSVFFVLSGFVISYVTESKEREAVAYASARIGRLYSVLVPAILISLLIQAVAWKLDNDYLGIWTKIYDPTLLRSQFLSVRSVFKSLAPLTFMGEVHGLSGYPALDSPMWSIGYEASYYALFGIGSFSKGALRIALLAGASLLIGPNILRLLPLWLTGVVLQRVARDGRAKFQHAKWLGFLSISIIGIQILMWHRARDWNFQPHRPWVQSVIHGYKFSEPSFLYYYWGLTGTLSILAVLIFEGAAQRILSPLEKPIRWFAGHTFSIYLFHYPVLVFLYAVFHYDRASHIQCAIVFISDLSICLFFSLFAEPTKRWWRSIAFHSLSRIFKLNPQPKS